MLSLYNPNNNRFNPSADGWTSFRMYPRTSLTRDGHASTPNKKVPGDVHPRAQEFKVKR